MNKETKNKILESYGKPVFIVGDKRLVFARQEDSDCDEIEKMTDEQLISNWKNLSWINSIYGQVSLNELQRIDLLELEISSRPDINVEELELWFKTEKENFEKEEHQY